MKKLIPFIVPMIILAACGEEKTVYVRDRYNRPAKAGVNMSGGSQSEQFRTIEKPDTYSGD
jgi:hypothetical protein